MSNKITVVLPDGKKFQHDFSCNGYYAEMFQVVREIFGLDLRSKWFKNLKDEFWNVRCFGDAKESRLLLDVDNIDSSQQKHH